MNDLEPIINQARDLGKKIAAHSRTQAFLTAARAVSEDKDAQAILKTYQESVNKMRALEAGGKPIEPEDKRKVADAERAMAGNDKLKAMMKEQANYLEMMHYINQAIDEASQKEPAN